MLQLQGVRIVGVIFLPASHSLSRRKQNKVKYKQKYQDLTIRVLLLFIFRFFTHSPICRLPFVLSLFSKEERENKKEKLKRKTPGNNVFTRKIQIQHQYKQISTCFCSCPLLEWSQIVWLIESRKKSREQGRKNQV